MVKIDDEVPSIISDVSKGIFHLGDAAIRRGKEVVAHRLGSAFLAKDTAVLKPDRRPALNREATILGVFFVAADEVGECSLNIVPKLRFGG